MTAKVSSNGSSSPAAGRITVVAATLTMMVAVGRSAAQDSIKAAVGLPIQASRTITFETTEGTAMNVDVSPDGKTIVFDLLGDIYTVPIEGGAATRITSGMAFDTEPVFSPDGRRIAFVSDRSGTDNVWVVDADGKNPSALTKETAAGVARPEWLTSGDFVIVARKADGYWMYRADGTGTAITPFLPAGVSLSGEAVWSRDGRVIYATDWGSIRRIDVAGRVAEVVHQRRPNGFRLTLSPDGRWLLFASQLDNQTGLRLLDLTTLEEKWLRYPLPDRDNSNLQGGLSAPLPRIGFLPDGKSAIIATGGTFQRLDLATGTLAPIQFRATVEQELGPRLVHSTKLESAGTVRGIRDPQRIGANGRVLHAALGKLWIREPNGTTAPLIAFRDSTQPLLLREPALSPDGRTVAFTTWHDASGGYLWTMPVTGGPPKRLTKLRGVYRHPAWSPDGSAIAVVREEEMGNRAAAARIPGEVYLVPANGGSPRRIVAVDADDRPGFSPDGRSVMVLRRPPASPPPGGKPVGVSVPTLLSVSIESGAIDTVATLPAGVTEVAVSPDGKMVGYLVAKSLYTASIEPIGGLPKSVAKVSPDGGLWSATRITERGGLDLRWEREGRVLTWIAGEALVRHPVDASRPADTVALAFLAPSLKGAGTVVLEGASIITMRGDEVIRDGSIVITDDRIVAVGSRSSIPVPSGARRIDVSGKTIIPGLVDLRGNPTFARDVLEGTNAGLGVNLAFGVTTIRGFLPSDSALEVAANYRQLIESGSMIGARLVAGGTAGKIANLEAARTMVREQRNRGAAAIVVPGTLSRMERQWVAIAATESGIPVVGETGTVSRAITLAADGYHTIQGSFPNAQLYDDVRRFLAESQVVFAPSLLTAPGGRRGDGGSGGTAEDYFLEMINLREDPTLQRFGLSDPGQVSWRLLEDYHFIPVAQQVDRLRRLGVPITVATEGKRPGPGVHWEIWALEMGGLSRHEALRAATADAANALGLVADLGAIDVGKIADVIVLDGDPLADLRQTRSIRYVMKDGVLFDAGTLAMIWPRTTPPLVVRDTRFDPPGRGER